MGGWTFQHPLSRGDTFVVLDFYHVGTKTALEIDGKYHTDPAQRTKDANRSLDMFNEHGINVVRCTNKEVFTSIPQVLSRIRRALSPPTFQHSYAPPPRQFTKHHPNVRSARSNKTPLRGMIGRSSRRSGKPSEKAERLRSQIKESSADNISVLPSGVIRIKPS